jgi:hypothetical protein
MGHSGPASPPTANLGAMANGMSKMREAIKLIELAIVDFPPGTEQHKDTIDALAKLAKAFPATEEVPGVQNTQLAALQQKARQTAMMQAAMRQIGGGPPGGGGAPPPQAAPAAPPEAVGA